VRLVAGGEQATIARLTVSDLQRTTTVPALDHTSVAVFGPSADVRLLGFDLEPADPAGADELVLTLYWRAEAGRLVDAKVFAHLVAPDGTLAAQHDGVPAQGRRPLAGWLRQEVVADRHVIALPPGAFEVPGWRVAVGLYDPSTMSRWPVRSPAGVDADSAAELPVGEPE
jgi:hypothetical protein